MVSKHVELVSEPDQMVHSTFHVCQNINQTSESTGPGLLYLWYEENREISEDFMATCRELPEEEEEGAWQKDQVYNQLEIYNYDVENDVWSGPDVYFSSPRSHGTDHTKPFDSFWLDTLKFKGDSCFHNYCDLSPCASSEECRQSWDYDVRATVLECCIEENCRSVDLPSMECKDQQAEIDEMKTEKQKFCQPLITEEHDRVMNIMKAENQKLKDKIKHLEKNREL